MLLINKSIKLITMKKLIFIYNSDSGFFSALTDFAHKAVSPETYQCSLCKLTYGAATMKKEWAAFIKSLSVPVEFMYKDKFGKAHPEFQTTFPVVLGQKEDGSLESVITTEELNAAKELNELMEKLGKFKS